jgi:hypothetical protein
LLENQPTFVAATPQRRPRTRIALVIMQMRDHARLYRAHVEDEPEPRDKPIDDEQPTELRLTHKFADAIDGVDLKGHAVGDTFKLPASEARLLIAEGWAVYRDESKIPRDPED